MSVPHGVRKPSRQVFVRPPGTDAVWLAERYFRWLDEALPAVRTEFGADGVSIFVWPFGQPAIAMRAMPTGQDRVEYRVNGGFLVASEEGGQFEFSDAAIFQPVDHCSCHRRNDDGGKGVHGKVAQHHLEREKSACDGGIKAG